MLKTNSSSLRLEKRTLGYLSGAPRVTTTNNADLSGPKAHVLGVIQAFRTLGWNVYPYIVGDLMPGKVIRESGDQLQKSWMMRFGADFVRLAMGIFHGFRCWRELHGKVEWIYERFAVFQALGWVFQRSGVPWVLETNGLIFYEAVTERKGIANAWLARIMELWAYRQCDVLVVITDTLKELIVDVAGIPANKVLVVPNGVDIDRFDPAKQDGKRFSSKITIGFVGALLQWHRLDVLLAALSEIKNDVMEFDLVIVGDGPMRDAWERQASMHDLASCSHFIGQVPWQEIPAYIAGFDLAYMGYSPLEMGKMYGSPIKLYEYMAMARTIISSSCADAQEMIVPGIHGYLFEPANKEDLKRVLVQAFQDHDRWHDMGLAARERVIEKASWTSRVENMLTGIERILEKRNAYSHS